MYDSTFIGKVNQEIMRRKENEDSVGYIPKIGTCVAWCSLEKEGEWGFKWIKEITMYNMGFISTASKELNTY